MAKKKQVKKHTFKHALPTPAAATRVTADPQTNPGVTLRDYAYVGRDLKRLLIFALALIMVQFIIWALFEHTGLGADVYGLVKL